MRKFMLANSNNYMAIAFAAILIVGLLFLYTSSKEGMECKVSELDARLAAPEKTLVLFYADWCGHCQRIEPVWDESAEKAKGRMLKRNVGEKTDDRELDAENKALLDKFKIDGFPTILVFQNGKAEPYKGTRSVEEFLNNLD